MVAIIEPRRGRRSRTCACGQPATVCIVVIRHDGDTPFGFCAQHLGTLLSHADIVAKLEGRAEIITTFTERRLRQLAEAPP